MKTNIAEPLLPLYRTAVPNSDDARLARDTSHVLARLTEGHNPVHLRLTENGGEKIVLPAPAVQLLLDMLSEMARGNTVLLVPFQAELTTQQAADLLNVSRPFLIQLLEEKKIPYHKVGSHRRIYAEDVLGYKRAIDRERRKVLDELAQEAQELGMGY